MLCNPDPLALTLLNYPAVLALHHHSSDWFLHFNSLPVSSDQERHRSKETSPEFALSRFAFYLWPSRSCRSGLLCLFFFFFSPPAQLRFNSFKSLYQNKNSYQSEKKCLFGTREAEGLGKEEKVEEEKQRRSERGEGEEKEEREEDEDSRKEGGRSKKKSIKLEKIK